MKEEVKETYLEHIKKAKLKINNYYDCDIELKDGFGNSYKLKRFILSLLDDRYEISPMIVCSFDDGNEIYFADEKLIIDKYDKNCIIKEKENFIINETYTVSLLKDLKKIVKEKKDECSIGEA